MGLTFTPSLLRVRTSDHSPKIFFGSATLEQKPLLGERYNDAMVYAARLHRYQVRKYGRVPYVAHLQSVAALVLRNGGDEDTAIAAWLHDAVEDQGGWYTLQDIRQRFGDKVAEMVKGCSDSFTEPPAPLNKRMIQWWRAYRQNHGLFQTTKGFLTQLIKGLGQSLSGKGPLFPEMRPPWLQRKSAYLRYLKHEAPPSVLLIAACDKLDNARSQLQEYLEHRENHWNNFSGGKDMLQYFDAVLKIFEARGFRAPVTEELARTVHALKTAVEKTTNQPLPSSNIFDGI
ncbi:MAG TPA: HD domain-containing protein [Oculatellaceae cyanobacterium]|jgi:hypothetical protein